MSQVIVVFFSLGVGDGLRWWMSLFVYLHPTEVENCHWFIVMDFSLEINGENERMKKNNMCWKSKFGICKNCLW